MEIDNSEESVKHKQSREMMKKELDCTASTNCAKEIKIKTEYGVIEDNASKKGGCCLSLHQKMKNENNCLACAAAKRMYGDTSGNNGQVISLLSDEEEDSDDCWA